MSDDTATPVDEPIDDADAAEGAEATESDDARVHRPAVANPLSRPTDAVARPGFRNPANSRSKAVKKKGAGKKKKR